MMNGTTTGWSRRRDLSPASPRHILQFYETEGLLCEAASEWISCGLAAGEAALMIASPARVKKIAAVMRRHGTDFSALVADGRLVVLDAEEILAAVMRTSMPDEFLFFEILGGSLEQSREGERVHTRVYGETFSFAAAGTMRRCVWRSSGTRLQPGIRFLSSVPTT